MADIKILDCTLRDGGYKNNWRFSNTEIAAVIKSLIKAKIEIIECGYLSEINGKKSDCSIFDSLTTLNALFKADSIDKENSEFAIMINYGEYIEKNIKPCCSKDFVKNIRVAFHKKDVMSALKFSSKLQEKGYNLFLQPMVISEYQNTEIEQLIANVNLLKPKALYIVDSLGTLNEKDVSELKTIFDYNLEKKIALGVHLHGDSNFTFSKALTFIKSFDSARQIFVDASINGLGRGKGNLETEKITDYMNESKQKHYNVDSLLKVKNEYLTKIYAGCV